MLDKQPSASTKKSWFWLFIHMPTSSCICRPNIGWSSSCSERLRISFINNGSRVWFTRFIYRRGERGVGKRRGEVTISQGSTKGTSNRKQGTADKSLKQSRHGSMQVTSYHNKNHIPCCTDHSHHFQQIYGRLMGLNWGWWQERWLPDPPSCWGSWLSNLTPPVQFDWALFCL